MEHNFVWSWSTWASSERNCGKQMTSRCKGDFQPATLLSPASRTLSSQSAKLSATHYLAHFTWESVAAWDNQQDKLICHTVCIHLLKQKMCHDFHVISLWLIIWEVNWENLWRTTLFQEYESERTSFNSSVTPLVTMALQWLKFVIWTSRKRWSIWPV